MCVMYAHVTVCEQACNINSTEKKRSFCSGAVAGKFLVMVVVIVTMFKIVLVMMAIMVVLVVVVMVTVIAYLQ